MLARISKESIPIILMITASLIAIYMANSPYKEIYTQLLDAKYTIPFSSLSKSIFLWVNDGLMAIFFFLVAIELKTHLTDSRIEKNTFVFPCIAALGGVIVPAIIYITYSYNIPKLHPGWAIPVATDIAFALGILSFFGKSISSTIRIFLLTLAIVDDIIAIVIIGVFYTSNLSIYAILLSIVISCILLLLRRMFYLWLYIALGILLWVCILNSGLHATLAGVILGLCLPKQTRLTKAYSMLSPYVYYGILPIFAFSNMGIPLTVPSFIHHLIIAISMGLILGKILGITSFYYLTKKLSSLPTPLPHKDILFISCLCGIGFTMSLFIATLAFSQKDLLSIARMGILIASTVSVLLAVIFSPKTRRQNNTLQK